MRLPAMVLVRAAVAGGAGEGELGGGGHLVVFVVLVVRPGGFFPQGQAASLLRLIVGSEGRGQAASCLD